MPNDTVGKPEETKKVTENEIEESLEELEKEQIEELKKEVFEEESPKDISFKTMKYYTVNPVYKKFLEVQKEIQPLKKDKENPFYNCSYFDINAILAELLPILNKNGLILMQPIYTKDGNMFIDTRIIDPDTGGILEETIEMKVKEDIQKQGSAITYYRRYALQSFLGLQAEDDDGNDAANKTKETKQQSTAQSNSSTTYKKSERRLQKEEELEKLILETDANKANLLSPYKTKEVQYLKSPDLDILISGLKKHKEDNQ